MDKIARFFEYAAAFEQAFATDDWSLLEPYFADDAVYEITGGPPFAGRHEGRRALVGFLRESVNGFDRRFATREVELRGEATLRDGAVHVPWRGIYRSPGLPDLVIEGEETAWFAGDEICRLEDRYTDAEVHKVAAYFADHAAALPPPREA